MRHLVVVARQALVLESVFRARCASWSRFALAISGHGQAAVHLLVVVVMSPLPSGDHSV